MEYPDISAQIKEVAEGYQFQKPPEVVAEFQELLTQLLQALVELLRSLRLRGPGATDSRVLSDAMQYILWIAGIVGIVVLAFVLFRQFRERERRIKLSKRGAQDIEPALDATGWRAEAQKLARAGEYRGACRAIYLSLLRKLDETGIAVFAPAKTNFEYRYLLAAHPLVLERFVRIATTVELVWFGNKHAEKGDFEQCCSDLEATELLVVDLVRQREQQREKQVEAAM